MEIILPIYTLSSFCSGSHIRIGQWPLDHLGRWIFGNPHRYQWGSEVWYGREFGGNTWWLRPKPARNEGFIAHIQIFWVHSQFDSVWFFFCKVKYFQKGGRVARFVPRLFAGGCNWGSKCVQAHSIETGKPIREMAPYVPYCPQFGSIWERAMRFSYFSLLPWNPWP
jgi:hypothetical protein